jgi:hypothetical protein
MRGRTYQNPISAYATRLRVNWIPKRTVGGTARLLRISERDDR